LVLALLRYGREGAVTAQDHNKTLVILHAGLGLFFTLGLIAAPWIIAQNFRRPDKILFAVIVFGVVFLVAILFWSTAIAMYRRKPIGRKLSLIASVVAIPMIWPVGVYTWWFMHSDAAKRIYGVELE
jgi:hypothetical protein